MIKTDDWQKIYSTHSPKLLGICRRYIQDLHTAEDILQDSFMAAIQNIHQLKDEKMLFAWLKKIVVNNALQHLRKSNHETFITDELPEIPESSHAMNSADEKAHVLAYDFTQEELLSSIDSLPHHHKSVFNLYFIENHSHAEIASELGITVNTSKSHLLRAKKAVQNYLLNKVQPNTPKNRKKLTQLLVFLGFGSLLWAQSLKNKFSDFSIPPSRILEVPEHTIPKHFTPISASPGFTKKMGMITSAGTLLIITIASVIVYRPNNNTFFRNFMNSGDAEMEQGRIQQKNETEQDQTSISDISHNTEKITYKEKAVSENTAITEEAVSNIQLKEHQLAIKDTTQEYAPRKVIVVKKIIQRDTIYIER